MEWGVILLGAILAIILVAKQETRSREKRNLSQKPSGENNPPPRINLIPPRYHYVPGDNPQFQIPNLPLPPSSHPELSLGAHYPWTPTRIATQPTTRNENRRERALVQNWKNSIIGLVKLADQNLQLAKRYMNEGTFRQTILAADTSLENMSRALIHCYGGKPETEAGQEEPLKLICGRFEGLEKEEFEKGIHITTEISAYARSILQTAEPNESQTRKMLESATHAVDLFKRVLTEHFATEIAELSEACPKCHSLNIWIGRSNPTHTNCECQICHHKWAEDPH